MKEIFQIFAAIWIFFCCVTSQAQGIDKDDMVKEDHSVVESFKSLYDNQDSKDERKKDIDALLRRKEAVESAESAYDISVYEHRRKVFEWQYITGIVIFWLVVLIVLLGLLFSGIQFYIGWKERGAGPTPDENQEATSKLRSNATESVTEFEASMGGIKVRSSIIGIIILVISLGFFYLYLVHVYPVKVVGTSGGNIITEKN